MNQQTQPLLEFRDVCKSYERTQAVAGISAAVARREFVALVGASGSGKSTLLKTVNRLVDPSSGTVLIDGDPVESLPLAALRRRIGYVFQSVEQFRDPFARQLLAADAVSYTHLTLPTKA